MFQCCHRPRKAPHVHRRRSSSLDSYYPRRRAYRDPIPLPPLRPLPLPIPQPAVLPLEPLELYNEPEFEPPFVDPLAIVPIEGPDRVYEPPIVRLPLPLPRLQRAPPIQVQPDIRLRPPPFVHRQPRIPQQISIRLPPQPRQVPLKQNIYLPPEQPPQQHIHLPPQQPTVIVPPQPLPLPQPQPHLPLQRVPKGNPHRCLAHQDPSAMPPRYFKPNGKPDPKAFLQALASIIINTPSAPPRDPSNDKWWINLFVKISNGTTKTSTLYEDVHPRLMDNGFFPRDFPGPMSMMDVLIMPPKILDDIFRKDYKLKMPGVPVKTRFGIMATSWNPDDQMGALLEFLGCDVDDPKYQRALGIPI